MQNGMVKNSMTFQTFEELPEDNIYQHMINIYSEIFEDADLDFFRKRIEEHSNLFSVLAYFNDQPIGFKVGYPYNEDTFYSWIGGVLPSYRQQGIGTQMAKIQDNFAKDKGFKKLRTKSMNTYKAMMILNIKNGFDITKVYTNTKGQTKIVFEKLF